MLSSWLVGLRIVPLVILNLGSLPSQNQAGNEQVVAYEKEMSERPLEAIAIARRASNTLGKDEKRLYKAAAELEEKNLALLGLGQIEELASVFEKKLDDSQGGRRVRLAWMERRGIGLTQDQVRQLLGPAHFVNSEIFYGRQIDQWVYQRPEIRIWFSCTKRQLSRVRAVHFYLLAP